MLLGTVLVVGRGRLLVLLVFALVSVEFRVRTEERLLVDAFGDEYRRYRRRVPQLIPRLRPRRKTIAEDVNAEQSQANALLQAIHAFITNIAHAQGDTAFEKPPLFAPGREPEEQPQPGYQQRGGLLGGMLGGGMMGGPMMGGYFGGGFARAMEMGAGVGLAQSLIGSMFRL